MKLLTGEICKELLALVCHFCGVMKARSLLWCFDQALSLEELFCSDLLSKACCLLSTAAQPCRGHPFKQWSAFCNLRLATWEMPGRAALGHCWVEQPQLPLTCSGTRASGEEAQFCIGFLFSSVASSGDLRPEGCVAERKGEREEMQGSPCHPE